MPTVIHREKNLEECSIRSITINLDVSENSKRKSVLLLATKSKQQLKVIPATPEKSTALQLFLPNIKEYQQC